MEPTHLGAEAAMQACDEPGPGWTVILRRRPARVVASRPDGGHAGAYELVCCTCGDHPDLDYRDVSPELQQIRGPYPVEAGIAAFVKHVEPHH